MECVIDYEKYREVYEKYKKSLARKDYLVSLGSAIVSMILGVFVAYYTWFELVINRPLSLIIFIIGLDLSILGFNRAIFLCAKLSEVGWKKQFGTKYKLFDLPCCTLVVNEEGISFKFNDTNIQKWSWASVKEYKEVENGIVLSCNCLQSGKVEKILFLDYVFEGYNRNEFVEIIKSHLNNEVNNIVQNSSVSNDIESTEVNETSTTAEEIKTEESTKTESEISENTESEKNI